MHLSPLLLFIQRDTVLLFELRWTESIRVARTIARVRQHDATGDEQTTDDHVRSIESSESIELSLGRRGTESSVVEGPSRENEPLAGKDDHIAI